MRYTIRALMGMGAVALLIWFSLIITTGNESNARASTQIIHVSRTIIIASPTPTPVASSGSSGGLNSTIIAALIGIGGVVLGALIAGGAAIGVAIYQARRSTHLQQEQLQTQHQQAQEIARLQQELQEQAAAKERERQRKEMNAAAALAAMEQATNRSERVNAYRVSLRADPRIARLQILDMDRPLEVANIYVRLRLHQDTRMRYEIETALLEAETKKDPNAFLQAQQLLLEQRASSALDPDEAIRTYKHCVVVGDPGAGKTTLLKYLALNSVENQLPGLPDLPIHIELNAFASSGHQDLLDFASSRWEARYGFPKADARSYMEEQLAVGKALLLLDALDETVRGETVQEAEVSYRRASEAILQVATRHHQAPIVVTVRKAGYQQHAGLPGFTQLEVLDFRAEDIQQFIRSWFACRPNPSQYATAADLQARLTRNQRIQVLAANPLLLSLIVLVYEEQLDLPDRRAELYNRCIETLLTKWDTSRDIRRLHEFKPERIRQLLEVIAWHFQLQGKRYFPDSELLNVIADFLPRIGLPAEKNARILEEIAAENGLLKEQAQGWHGFLHLTLQEYFVAEYITNHHQLETLLEHRGDPWWEEVFLLFAGRVADASPLFRRRLGQDDTAPLKEDIFWTNLLLAGRCLATRPTIWQTTLRDEVVSHLFHTLTTTPYSLAQELIAGVLAEIGGKETNTHLVRLLSDKQLDASVRRSIADALGASGERSIAPELVRLLSDKQLDASVRTSIAYALRALGERSIAPELVRLLSDEQLDDNVRASIARTLGALGERSIAPELVRLLSDEQLGGSVSLSIAAALGALGERSIAPELVRRLSDEQLNDEVRWNIAYDLRALGERSIAPELVRLLSDEQLDASVRWTIADTLGDLGERSIAPELVRLLSDEQLDAGVCTSIVDALGALGERSIAPELVRLLSDEQLNDEVRTSIADALGNLVDDDTTVYALATIISELVLMPETSNITNAAYTALWIVSRQTGFRVFMTETPEEKHNDLAKW